LWRLQWIRLNQASIIFTGVIAVDFQINYFDNSSHGDLFGFYEIFDDDAKKEMIEKVFSNRLNGYLYNGDYNYCPYNDNDLLNYREPINKILKEINKYRLYQQNTVGGIYYVLALKHEICV